jgi:alpha-beta hydrolase superfamily lysophospholipase
MARGAGVVLCNTLGDEALRAYGTLRHLAESLAEAGFSVLRFDFHGTGDSGGSEADPDRLATWLEDIDLAIQELRDRSGLRQVALAGLRLGGTLALIAGARHGDVESVVLWNPFYSGRDFVTETTRMRKALAMLEPSGFALKRPEGSCVDGVEGLGVLLSHATIADLGKIDLPSVERLPARRVLIVSPASAEKRGAGALMNRLCALGAEVEYEVLAVNMNKTLRLVSAEDHARIAADITRWMASRLGTTDRAADPIVDSPASVLRRTEAVRAEMDEEPLFFGEGDSLFGIVTHPGHGHDGDDRPAIILVNAWLGTRVGPHRQYVRMARAWAKLGFIVLRMDLPGSGDSALAGATEDDPYPPRAIAHVQDAMTRLQERFTVRRFVIAGVCSGADIAFRASIEDPRVVGTMMVNPRTFALYNIPDLEQIIHSRHLATTFLAKKNWRMLLGGEAGLKGSLAMISRVCREAALNLKQKLAALLGPAYAPAPVVDVPREVRRVLARGVDTLLVVVEHDVGITYVELFFREGMRALERSKGFRRVEFRGVDHVFTSLYAQEMLLETLTEHLGRTFCC